MTPLYLNVFALGFLGGLFLRSGEGLWASCCYLAVLPFLVLIVAYKGRNRRWGRL